MIAPVHAALNPQQFIGILEVLAQVGGQLVERGEQLWQCPLPRSDHRILLGRRTICELAVDPIHLDRAVVGIDRCHYGGAHRVEAPRPQVGPFRKVVGG